VSNFCLSARIPARHSISFPHLNTMVSIRRIKDRPADFILCHRLSQCWTYIKNKFRPRYRRHYVHRTMASNAGPLPWSQARHNHLKRSICSYMRLFKKAKDDDPVCADSSEVCGDRSAFTEESPMALNLRSLSHAAENGGSDWVGRLIMI